MSHDPAANAPAPPDRRFATIKGILSALLGYFLFSSSDAVIKLLLGQYSTFQILPFQALFAIRPARWLTEARKRLSI